MALLQIRGLNKQFGGLAATVDLDMDVNDKEIVGVIGPNGAGKSTLFNMISGYYPPTSGSIVFLGDRIDGLRADQVARKGIGRTFQAATLFGDSTVFDNVLAGFHTDCTQPGWKVFLHLRSVRDEEAELSHRASRLLSLMGIGEWAHELAHNLPYGYQKVLGVCIALASGPRLLLLDEPLTGMNATEKQAMVDKIRTLRESGLTIMLVEHDMKSVMGVCDRLVVLNYGKKIAEGRPDEIRANPEVVKAYLGSPRARKHAV
jgi:branched-chain amino acid transport system ATP-binding protein